MRAAHSPLGVTLTLTGAELETLRTGLASHVTALRLRLGHIEAETPRVRAQLARLEPLLDQLNRIAVKPQSQPRSAGPTVTAIYLEFLGVRWRVFAVAPAAAVEQPRICTLHFGGKKLLCLHCQPQRHVRRGQFVNPRTLIGV